MVGKARSCTACRQAKVACNARSTTAIPCSQCIAKGFECRFDKNFKRVPTRQIARDIAIVRASQNHHVLEAATPPVAADCTPERAMPSALPIFFMSHDSMEGSQDFSLGSLSITPEVIVVLLQHFQSHYFPHVPFLQPIRSARHFVSQSPLLFWTIVLISCQHHETHHGLYEQLFYPHRELLIPISHTAVLAVGDIHALLLLCLWPIPRKQFVLDPCWSYIGIAINSCTRLGFHNSPAEGCPSWPKPAADVSIHTQRLTWLACFTISIYEATWLGFLPPLSSSSHLKYVRKTIDLLNGLLLPEHKASLAINEIECNFNVSLEDVGDPAAHISLTQTFDGTLDYVKRNYLACWTTELGLQLNSAKLYLYSMAALTPLRDRNSLAFTQNIIDRQLLSIRGLEAAAAIISDLKKLSMARVIGGQYATGRLTFYPRRYFSMLFYAVVFLFRQFLNDQPFCQAHRTAAIQHVSEALKVFQLASDQRDLARAAKLTEVFIDLARGPDGHLHGVSFLTEFSITNRLGASLMWDTIYQIKLEASALLAPRRSEHASNCRIMAGLPPAPEMKGQPQDTAGVSFDPHVAQNPVVDDWPYWDAFMDGAGLDINQYQLWP